MSDNKKLKRVGLQVVSVEVAKAERYEAYEESDENCGIHQEQRHKCRPPVTESVGDGTSNNDSDESAALSCLEKRRLPFSWNGVLHNTSGIRPNLNTISFFEVWQGDKVAAQEPGLIPSQ